MSDVKLRPPPSVKDIATFDRWLRESLLGFLANGNTSGLQAADSDLTALAALSGTGIAVRTAAGAWALRSLAEGSNINIANADGVAGDPAISATGGGDTTVSTNVIADGVTVTITDEHFWLVADYLDIRGSGALDIQGTGILELV